MHVWLTTTALALSLAVLPIAAVAQTQYTYDAQGRLVQVARPGVGSTATTTYDFDDADNRLARDTSVSFARAQSRDRSTDPVIVAEVEPARPDTLEPADVSARRPGDGEPSSPTLPPEPTA